MLGLFFRLEATMIQVPGVEEIGKTTRSFMDALKDQPAFARPGRDECIAHSLPVVLARSSIESTATLPQKRLSNGSKELTS